MESEFARRRISTISGHFVGADDLSTGVSCSLPLNCSSSLSLAVTSYDNKVFFARQGSSAQSCFMRQASMDLGNPYQPGGAFSVYGSADTCNALEAPLFSRPAKVVHDVSFNSVKHADDDCRLSSAAEPSKYARSSSMPSKYARSSSMPSKYARSSSMPDGEKQFGLKKEMLTTNPPNGVLWSPKKNIAESKCKYVICMELPGVKVGDIRVEVNAKSLTITGSRSTKWGCCSNNLSTTTTYHKREIMEGPYQVVWPLPDNVNKDGISAEFVEGILQINIPKL